MADQKLTDLTTLASLTTDDLIYVVDDPAGTPASRKVAVSVLDARYQAADATLTALAAYNTNGLITQTAADTFAGRTLTAPAAGFTITNPAGIAGNPTFVLANDLSALEGLASTGIAARTAADTWAQRTITAGTGIGVADGNGVAGNPTVSISDAELLALAGLTSAADALPYFTGIGTAAVTTLTSFIRGLLDDSSASAARTTLGVVIGTDVQAFDADLTAIAGLAATAGMLSRTGAGAFAARTLTEPAAGLTITNPTGSAGNPTFALANDLGALEGLASTGIAVRSAADTWVQRTITAGNNISVSNGNGVSGNPTIAATAAGSDSHIQYNNGGTNFGGEAALTWNDTSDILSVTGVVEVNQSSTTGALPVLQLTQADVSEEFIRFIGTSANGVLTQSIVEDADVTTATRAGWLKIYVNDAGNQLTDQAYYISCYTLA